MSGGRDLFGRPLPTGNFSSPNESSSSSTPQPPRPPQAVRRDMTPVEFSKDSAGDEKMAAFRKLKPICVQLMGLAGQPPTSSSRHAALLDALRATASTLPDRALAPSLINYILFPLTTILRTTPDPSVLPDNFLESAFRLLTFLVGHWRLAPGGMDVAAWEQLWRLCISATAPSGNSKGKGKEAHQEVCVEAVALLAALLDHQPGGPGRASHPTPAMRKAVTGTSAPMLPTLFRSITFALSCTTPEPPHSALQRSAVALLRTLLGYLAGQSELLASVLPGVISGMSRGIAMGKALKGDVAASMAGAVQDVIVETLSDAELRRLGILHPQFNDLADLADQWERTRDSATTPEPASPPQNAPPNPFPPITKAYLSFTASQLQSTIPPILQTLTGHPSHFARMAAGDLAYTLTHDCHEALPQLLIPALSTLLLLSADEFDPVRLPALTHLKNLLSSDIPDLDTALLDTLSNGINALPRLIRSSQDARVDELARIVTAIAAITKPDAHPNPIAGLLGPHGHVERWAWGLLDCLEFRPSRGWSTKGSGAGRIAQLGWTTGLVTSSLPLVTGAEGDDTKVPEPDMSFPRLPLRYVESEHTTKHLRGMLFALGRAGGDASLHAIDYFIRFAHAQRTRHTAKAASAVWVTEALLEGVASPHAGKRQPKNIRKMARQVARIAIVLDDDDEDEEGEEEEAYKPEMEEEQGLVERKKGLDQLTTLLDRNPLSNSAQQAETRALHARAQRVVLAAASLSALAGTARILGTSFRPLLLHALYGVLASLSSPSDVVRSAGEAALSSIAYHAGYASPANMVLDNVDYVVNAVSRRLTHARLSANAPLVLVAMIRLVGAPIVPLVHDVVDEIFDALDDFHGYAALVNALLAVLNTLVEVMHKDVDIEGRTAEREQEMADARKMFAPPSPVSDFAKFGKWFKARGEAAQAEMDDVLARAPKHAWGKYDPANAPNPVDPTADPDAMDADPPPKDEEPTPPTRTQEIGAAILTKATYYLSQASPVLRARVLTLIASCIPVLASGGRASDVLPVIDRAWSLILTRLDDVPFVAVAAAEVIAALAAELGEYVGQRIATDAWPRLKKRLDAQAAADAASALTRRGVAASAGEGSVSYRLHVAILAVAEYVALEVPVKEQVLWDMAVSLRSLLDTRVDRGVQESAGRVYAALARRDGDAVWVCLGASCGEMRGVFGWLEIKGEAREGVARVAERLDVDEDEAAEEEPIVEEVMEEID